MFRTIEYNGLNNLYLICTKNKSNNSKTLSKTIVQVYNIYSKAIGYQMSTNRCTQWVIGARGRLVTGSGKSPRTRNRWISIKIQKIQINRILKLKINILSEWNF